MSIKPSEEAVVVPQNPIEWIVQLVALVGKHPDLFDGAVEPSLIMDCTMMCDQEVPMGLKHPWARKVGGPVMLAYRILESQDPDPHAAIKALEQCSYDRVREACIAHVRTLGLTNDA